MTVLSTTIRVAITQIPDVHLMPGWDRQFEVEHAIDLEIRRVNSKSAHALLSGESGEPYDVAIVAEEPTLAQYPPEAYEHVLVGVDTFSLVVRRDDDHPSIAALRESRPYLKHQELERLLLELGSHQLLMRERHAGLNVFIIEHLLGDIVAGDRVGSAGCRLLGGERTNEALVGGLLAGERRISIVPNSVLRDVAMPRDRFDVLPIIHAPFRPYFMLRRRGGEMAPEHRASIEVLWDYLLDFVGAHREQSQLGDRAPTSRRPQAALLGIDIVDFSLMRLEHQRASVRLLNSVTQHVVANIEPVRRALWTAISTGDGLILVLDGELSSTALFDAAVGINQALRQLFDTLGRNFGLSTDIGARMSLHFGPVLTVYDPGGDLNFVGPGVNDLQRILEFGNRGQILVTPEGFEKLRAAEGFEACSDASWSGWDKHGIEHEVRSIWGEGFGDPREPGRRNLHIGNMAARERAASDGAASDGGGS